MMGDTPSNYNIANGRFEGKSMGLKAILLFAKTQGIYSGQNGVNQDETNSISQQIKQAQFNLEND